MHNFSQIDKPRDKDDIDSIGKRSKAGTLDAGRKDSTPIAGSIEKEELLKEREKQLPPKSSGTKDRFFSW